MENGAYAGNPFNFNNKIKTRPRSRKILLSKRILSHISKMII